MSSRTIISLLATILSIVIVNTSLGDDTKPKVAPTSMPVYVTPYYNSEGMKISVGPMSDRLARADAGSILTLSDELRKDQDKLRCEVMYVMAIRLYDLGQKDEAVYWFYSAQDRAKVFTSILDKDKIGAIGSEPFELEHAYEAFNQLAGEYINGYAFGDLPKLQKTLQQVIDEGKSLPKFGDLYPKVSFIAEGEWPAKNKEVSEGLSGLIDYINGNADSIKAQRQKNGVEGKY